MVSNLKGLMFMVKIKNNNHLGVKKYTILIHEIEMELKFNLECKK